MNVVKIIRRYRVKGWDSEGDAEGPGEIVKGLSRGLEAVRLMKRPGSIKFHFKRLQRFIIISIDSTRALSCDTSRMSSSI